MLASVVCLVWTADNPWADPLPGCPVWALFVVVWAACFVRSPFGVGPSMIALIRPHVVATGGVPSGVGGAVSASRSRFAISDGIAPVWLRSMISVRPVATWRELPKCWGEWGDQGDGCNGENGVKGGVTSCYCCGGVQAEAAAQRRRRRQHNDIGALFSESLPKVPRGPVQLGPSNGTCSVA